MAIEYIKSFDELLKMVSNGEHIFWLYGSTGRNLLNLLRYMGRANNICVVVQESTSWFNNFLCGAPVIHLANMPHFRETATFTVIAPVNQNATFHGKLEKYGCKKIFCLTAEVHKAVQDMLNQLKDSGAVTMWFLNHLMDRMTRMEHQFNMHYEVCKVNSAAFSSYENCYRGKKVVLVQNGATAKYYKPIPDAIHIAVEGAWRRTDIPFDFVFTHNPGEGGSGLEAALGRIRNRAFVGKFVTMTGGGYSEYYTGLNDKVARYFIGDNTYNQMIYRDISCHPMTDFWGAWSAALQFAMYTFPSEIHLVGCDAAPNEGRVSLKKVGWARLKMLAGRYYPGTKIISVNPIGLKGLFQDVFTDEYKATLVKPEPPKSEAPAK